MKTYMRKFCEIINSKLILGVDNARISIPFKWLFKLSGAQKIVNIFYPHIVKKI
jgi:hypothetical protein